jgi:putative membrane protein
VADSQGAALMPNFDLLMVSGVTSAVVVLAYFVWRFGVADTINFAILSGGFSAILDFLSSFAAENYVYPGQSQLWVFTYIFFGWIAMCGMSLLIDREILLKNSIIWVRDFSCENQTTLNLTYK